MRTKPRSITARKNLTDPNPRPAGTDPPRRRQSRANPGIPRPRSTRPKMARRKQRKGAYKSPNLRPIILDHSGEKVGYLESSFPGNLTIWREIMTFNINKYIRHSGTFVGNVIFFPGNLHFFQPCNLDGGLTLILTFFILISIMMKTKLGPGFVQDLS